MFDMSPSQKQAFSDATNGILATTFSHVILFFIGALMVFWIFMVFMGLFKNKERPVYDSLYEFAFAVGLFTAIGIVIYYG